MIKKLTALNVKGRNFLFQFSELNIISGSNFRGKTAILDAIKLAVLSFIPELGKTGKANFQLAGGESNEISADLEMSDGSHLSRKLEMVKGSVKSTGTDPVEMPLLTPEDYFQMSDKARREYVASRFGGGLGITVEEIIAGMERHSFEKDHSEEVEAAKPTVIGWIRNTLGHKGNLSDLIGLAIECLKENYASFNSKAKDTAGAVRTLSELKAKEQNFDRVNDLKSQIASMETVRDSMNKQFGELVGKKKGAQTAMERAERLRKELGEVLDFDKEIAKVTQKITDEQDTATIKEEGIALAGNKQALNERLSELQYKLGTNAKELAAAEDELKELEHLKSCPFCKSKGKGWDQTLREHYTKTISECGNAQNGFNSQCEQINAELLKVNEKLEELRSALTAANAANAATAEALKEIEDLKRNQKAVNDARKVWQEELDSIGEQEIPDQIIIDAAEQKCNETQGTLNALNERLSSAIGIQNDIKRAAEAAEANKSHTATMTVIKAFGKKLTEIQAEAVGGVFTEMLVIANKIAEGILLSPIAYHEGEIGRWDNGKFISHLTFSGCEKTITYSAIAAALSSRSPYKIMLVDELSRLTPQMAAKLMERLKECVEDGTLDQVILAFPSDSLNPHDYEGWNQIQVS